MTYREVSHSSKSAEWPTPAWLVEQLAAEFGPFDLDPAATADNAKAPAFFTAADDGLMQPWHGLAFCNPPYGRLDSRGREIGAWLRKAAAEVACGRVERAVCLVPARPDTRWWRDAVSIASLVRVYPGRLSFGSGRAPFASAIIVFGKLPGRHGTKPAWCQACKGLFWPARSDFKACSRKCRRALAVTG